MSSVALVLISALKVRNSNFSLIVRLDPGLIVKPRIRHDKALIYLLPRGRFDLTFPSCGEKISGACSSWTQLLISKEGFLVVLGISNTSSFLEVHFAWLLAHYYLLFYFFYRLFYCQCAVFSYDAVLIIFL